MKINWEIISIIGVIIIILFTGHLILKDVKLKFLICDSYNGTVKVGETTDYYNQSAICVLPNGTEIDIDKINLTGV